MYWSPFRGQCAQTWRQEKKDYLSALSVNIYLRLYLAGVWNSTILCLSNSAFFAFSRSFLICAAAAAAPAIQDPAQAQLNLHSFSSLGIVTSHGFYSVLTAILSGKWKIGWNRRLGQRTPPPVSTKVMIFIGNDIVCCVHTNVAIKKKILNFYEHQNMKTF